jgi:hypothetical protein
MSPAAFCAFFLLASSAFAENAWVLVRDEQRVTMSGSLKNLEQARKHLKKFGPGYLWFRRGSKAYVVRDGKFLREVERVVRPDEAVSSADVLLEKEDAELERHQQRLERHQAALEEWEDMGAGEQLAREREKLARDQEALGREQEKLAREQEKLGKEQERSAHDLDRKMAGLIDQALRQHWAEEVN